MNLLSIRANLREYKHEMVLKIPIALFCSEVRCINSVEPRIEIDDKDLIRLRDFLNLFFPEKE